MADNAILVGPRARIEEFQKSRLRRLRRNVRLTRTDRLAGLLARPDKLEFDETPLPDVLEYLRELHRANFVLARGPARDKAVTFRCPREAALASALDLMLFRVGLTWDRDGEVLYVGDQKAVDAWIVLERR